jgi:hypothetical protein
MKKVLLLGSALVLGTFINANAQAKQAQYTSLGPVMGIGSSRITNMAGSENAKFSPSLGVGLVYAKDAHWGWGGELAISHEGYSTNYGINTMSVNPVYLRVPLRAYYFFGDYKSAIRPKVYLGPTFGLKLDEVQYINGTRMNNSDATPVYTAGTKQFRTFDLGFNTGAGLNVRLATGVWLNMDMGYNMGFIDAVRDNVNSGYNVNENLRFNAGVLFGLK